MHFFYLDESGDTGVNLDDANQPVIVLGGIGVRDKGWNITQERLQRMLCAFFGGAVPVGFELHATDLLCPRGEGPFAGIDMERRCALCLNLLRMLAERQHSVHYIAIDKRRLQREDLPIELTYDPRQPYLLGFDYLITYINWHVKDRLGSTARGMIILDEKDQHHDAIERLMHDRRFGGTAAHRVKWIVEFSYAVDSNKNPMVQLSDLVIYCVKRFIEAELGYRENWSAAARNFYAQCFALISAQVSRAALVERDGRNMQLLNRYLEAVRAAPRLQWRRHYDLGDRA